MTRRIVDRLVSYLVSPLASKALNTDASFSRAELICLRLLVEREREIASFTPTTTWTLIAQLVAEESDFEARLCNARGAALTLSSQQQADKFAALLANVSYLGRQSRQFAQWSAQRPEPIPAKPYSQMQRCVWALRPTVLVGGANALRGRLDHLSEQRLGRGFGGSSRSGARLHSARIRHGLSADRERRPECVHWNGVHPSYRREPSAGGSAGRRRNALWADLAALRGIVHGVRPIPPVGSADFLRHVAGKAIPVRVSYTGSNAGVRRLAACLARCG